MGNILKSIWVSVSPFIGVFFIILLFTIIIILAKILFKKKQAETYYYQITSLLLVLFGLFLMVLFLPISGDIKKQILTMFGVLLSAAIALSSTSLIGNAMAGIMLRVSKSYRPGDFIEVQDTIGRVFKQGLLSTELQIITRDTISFPNIYLIQHPIRTTRADGSFISASVSLSYDVSRAKIEECLMKAAEKTGLEESFVFVESLLDHAIKYRVFGFLKETARMLSLKSDLRKTVVDILHEEGIEIVSPSFVIKRVFDDKKKFVPKYNKNDTMTEVKDSNVEELAFDKADEAETIEKMKEKYNNYLKEKDKLEENIKEEKDKEKIEQIREEIQRLNKKTEMLILHIEKLQKEKEDNS